jgi:histidyl-tRNA synthetase
VFEIAASELGAQNSIGGGGRYDGLCSLLGGPDLPAFGYASGLERILQTMMKQKTPFPKPPHPVVFLVPIGDAAYSYCYDLLFELRHKQIPAEMDLSGKKVQHGLQLANAENADYCIVIGDQELDTRKVELKKMATREAKKIDLSEILECLTGF